MLNSLPTHHVHHQSISLTRRLLSSSDRGRHDIVPTLIGTVTIITAWTRATLGSSTFEGGRCQPTKLSTSGSRRSLHPHLHQNPQPVRILSFFSKFISHRGDSVSTNEPGTLSPSPDPRNSALSLSHSREPSAQSGVSGAASADSHDIPSRSRVGQTYRNQNDSSSAGSMFTALSRTLSSNLNDGPLTSPLMIYLNPTSPPLTHTASSPSRRVYSQFESECL